MDINTTEISDRIKHQFDLGKKTLFWEDETGEYLDVIDSIDVGDGSLVDATASELAAKRLILRDRPSENVIVYRSGSKPLPQDDFLYDIKLSSTPFSCKMESIWATECGIPADLSDSLADNARFFNSKERRARLAESPLDKATEHSVRVAMLATLAGSRSDSHRDAIRDTVGRLLTELGRGQDKTMKAIGECGLAPTLWSEVSSIIGYAAPAGSDPSVEDLAIKMIKSRCGDLIEEGEEPLGADAARVLNDLAANSRTREAFDALTGEYQAAVAELVDASKRNAEAIGTNDTLPIFDDWILSDMLTRLLAGTLRPDDAHKVMNARKHTLWFERCENKYAAILAAATVLDGISSYQADCTSKTTEREIFDAYVGEWYRVDEGYRHFVNAMRSNPSRSNKAFARLSEKVDHSYGKFLLDLTDRWQLHIMDGGAYPPPTIPSQDAFFYERVEKQFPRAEVGKRMGLIISDALRYEVGAELAARISSNDRVAGRAKRTATCDGMVCMLPSYTQLGMAALLPHGDMEIVPETENVLKDGIPTNGITNRQKIVEAAMPGAVLIQASEVLESGPPDAESAPLVVVYHNSIDKRGDSRDTEGEVFSACEDAIQQISSIADDLFRAGCGKVLVTADHGFLYQDRAIEGFNYAAIEGLADLSAAEGKPLTHSRRFIIGTALPSSDSLYEYAPAELSLKGDYKVALPRGISRLRLRGSGARYVHGGASLQENVVPVVTIEQAKKSQAATRTGVQGFLCGRPAITGSTVALDVYQTEPCSDRVTPLTVKVGLYGSADNKRLLCSAESTVELASFSPSSEERKTRLELHVTDDVDDCGTALLRISSRIGNTNQFRPEWEQKLSVNRAFGNDFDF